VNTAACAAPSTARFQQQRAHGSAAVSVRRRRAGVAVEGDLRVGRVVTVESDHHRLKGPLVTAVHGRHGAGRGRGVAHAGQALVLIQRLAAPHAAAGLHQEGGLQAHGIGAEQGHLGTAGRLDHLLRGTGQRQIEPAANPVQ
jgi:hypothetical protein